MLEELHRMRLTAIGTISSCNTIKSLDNCIIQRDNPYWTAAFDDVVTAIFREIVLLKEKKDLEVKLEKAVELIDCTSNRWGRCNCKSCKFLEKLKKGES